MHMKYNSYLSPSSAFVILLFVRALSAFFSNISDCDETFNYWEPTHFLQYGSGFQTWEYSPAYAIRSYGYLFLHRIPLLFTNCTNKIACFYLLRVILSTCCALCESYFYKAILLRYGRDVALWSFAMLLGSCGMYISAAAYLPSSFSMYCAMVAVAAWLLGRYELAIFSVATSAVVGWPFSAALGIPLAVDLLVTQNRPLFFLLWSSVSFVCTAGPLFLIDSLYYGKAVLAPWNIVLYNVMGNGGGPELYGTEPWSFYFANGILNFNVVFPLALLAFPLLETKLVLDWLFQSSTIHTRSCRAVPQMVSIWALIFFTRPHKEERFLFPIYPLLCLSAAISLQVARDSVWFLLSLRVPRRLTDFARFFFHWLPLIVCLSHALISASRGMALYKGYHAPLSLYQAMNSREVVALTEQPQLAEVNLCVSKEWYRFPSSYFLPNKRWKLRFIRSNFRGQLPKPYSTYRNATSVTPKDMNDLNKEEVSRYFDLDKCHFLVDLDLPVATELEPRYSQQQDRWEVLLSCPFLDSSRSHWLYRAFYFPWLSAEKTTFVDYVLLKNKLLLVLPSDQQE